MTLARLTFVMFTLGVILTACESARSHRESVQDTAGDRVSVGTVQRQIRVGMSGAEVAQVLGSPNIVTTDDQRREVWVYDKISTTNVYSTSAGSASLSGGSALGLLAVPALIIGSFNAQSSGSAGASSTSQKTFTVIIKYDESGRVRDFAYHTSRF
jgi:outer membrane protein assembly factor BamE (lipoprotein component of BamABCDE complex)